MFCLRFENINLTSDDEIIDAKIELNSTNSGNISVRVYNDVSNNNNPSAYNSTSSNDINKLDLSILENLNNISSYPQIEPIKIGKAEYNTVYKSLGYPFTILVGYDPTIYKNSILSTIYKRVIEIIIISTIFF